MQVITHVEVTPSSGSDAGVTVGVIDTLRERGIGPSELWCDTTYGSGHNGWEAERRGTELVSPVGGRAPGEADEDDGLVRLTAADFDIDVTARRAAVCPAGHEAVSEYEDEDAPERVEMHFAREVCEPCWLRPRCPVRWRRRPELGGEWSPSGAYVLSADLASVNIGRRRRAESDGQWRKRYGSSMANRGQPQVRYLVPAGRLQLPARAHPGRLNSAWMVRLDATSTDVASNVHLTHTQRQPRLVLVLSAPDVRAGMRG